MMKKISPPAGQSNFRKSGIVALFLAPAILMAGCSSGPPPKTEMNLSKAAVARATSNADTAQFAPVELQSAKDKLARAEKAMSEEKYELAKELAAEAQVDAKLAEAKSQSAKTQKAAQDSQEAIRLLREEANRNTQ